VPVASVEFLAKPVGPSRSGCDTPAPPSQSVTDHRENLGAPRPVAPLVVASTRR